MGPPPDWRTLTSTVPLAVATPSGRPTDGDPTRHQVWYADRSAAKRAGETGYSPKHRVARRR